MRQENKTYDTSSATRRIILDVNRVFNPTKGQEIDRLAKNQNQNWT